MKILKFLFIVGFIITLNKAMLPIFVPLWMPPEGEDPIDECRYYRLVVESYRATKFGIIIPPGPVQNADFVIPWHNVLHIEKID